MRLNGWQRIGIVALVALVAATSFAEAAAKFFPTYTVFAAGRDTGDRTGSVILPQTPARRQRTKRL